MLYVSQSGLTPRRLYRELSIQMGLKPAFHAADARRQLIEALWDAYKNHDKQPVIIIDEGHLLSAAMLEEIRFLTNFQMDAASPMALILVGQTELRHRLRLQTCEAIAQRVNLRFHLAGLSAKETRSYIQHHLQVANVKHTLFSESVVLHFAG
ncbi:MAG: ExeA family protein [Desulfotomaculales bacterium]